MPLRLAPAPLTVRKPAARRTVLIADRDEIALDAMRRYLLTRGYAVETATGGVECLIKLRRCEEPILVLEFELPWGGGDGVLAVLREDPQLVHTPVILTSPVVGSDEARFGCVPVLRVLAKPFSLGTLLHCLRTAGQNMPWVRGGGRPPEDLSEAGGQA